SRRNAMLHLTTTITLVAFAVCAALVALATAGERFLRDRLRQAADSGGKPLIQVMAATSALMVVPATFALIPIARAQLSLATLAAFQAGLLLLLVVVAGLDTLQLARGERQLRNNLAAAMRELEGLKHYVAERQERQALEDKGQIRQFQDALLRQSAP